MADEVKLDTSCEGTNEIGLPSDLPVCYPILREIPGLQDPVAPNEVCPLCDERTSKPGGPNPMVMFEDREKKDEKGNVLNPNRLQWVGCTACLTQWANEEPLRMLLLKVAWFHTTGCPFPKRKVRGGLAIKIDEE